MIRRIRLFPLVVLAMIGIATFHVSANDQQTGTWKLSSPAKENGDQPAASDAATPQGLHRTALGGGLIGRGAAATVLADGGILVAGGQILDRESTDVVRFDVNAGVTLLQPLNIGRASHTATTLIDGRVLVVGGVGEDGAATGTAEIFENGTWTVVRMYAARAHHTATLLKDGRVLIAGGDRLQGSDGSGAPRVAPTATLEIFDPATNQFTFAGVMSAARARHAAALLSDGTVLIAGGESRNAVTGDREVLTSTEILDIAAQSRREGPAMDIARMNFTATSLVNGDVLIAGGNDGTRDTASAERYDASESTFVPVGWLQQARESHVALRLPDNNGVLIAGGALDGEPLVSSEMFLPASGMFVLTGNTVSTHVDGVVSRTTESGTAVIMGGGDATAPETYAFATITTDKSDYAPGETVTITGTGWVPGELVTLELREDPFIDAHPLTPVYADADGNIVSREFAPDINDVGITFYLTARGSVSEAQTVFTDGTTTVTGFVKSSASGNPPIVGATVSCGTSQGCNNAVSTTTDSTGHYSLQVNFPGSSANISLTASATGFSSVTTVLAVSNAVNNPTLNFTLTPTVTSTTTTISSNNNPSAFGQSITFTATVTPSTATGSVTFRDESSSCSDGTLLSTTPLSGGQAQLSTSSLSAGSHTIRACFEPTGSFAASNGTLSQTVNKADQAITFGALGTKTYGDADFLVSATGGASGNAVTFTASGDCTVSTATVHIAHAGSCTITAHQDGNSNYNAAPDVPQTFTINKANPVCAITGYSVTYDAHAHTATGACKGAFNETLSGLELSETTHTDAGTYNGDAWTFTDTTGDYNDTSGSVDDAIAKADASCAVNSYSVTYDATAHTATGSCLGVESETLTGLNLTGTTHTNAGTYNLDPWTFTDVTGNYNDTSGTVNDAIAKADASVLVNGYSGTYDGSAHGASLDHATGVGGVDLSAGVNLGATFTNVPGGTAHWTFTGGTNYNDKNGDATITITPANADCTVTGYSVTYDTTAHTAAGSCAGVNGETLTGLDLSGTTHTNAGTYNGDPWTFTDVTGNYNNTSGTVNDLVKKADADCASIAGYSVTYNAQTHTATGECKGVDGSTLTGLDLSGTTHTDAGTYNADPWTFTDVTGNYNNTGGTVKDTIAKADASVVVNGYSGTYDGGAHGASLDHATGVNGVNLSAGIALGSTFINVPGGTAHWTFSGGTNYNDQSGDVTITIAKADANCSSIAAYNVIYDGHSHTAAGNCTGVGGAALAGLDLTPTTHVPANVYHDSWNFTDVSGNYNNTSGTLTDVISYNVCVLYDQTKPNKKGSTIPLKISLCDASGNNVSSPDIEVQAVTLTKVSGSVPPFDAEDSGNANPDLNFRYAGGFYIFNLSTKNPGFSEGEWKLQFTVNGIPNGYILTFFLK